MVCTARASLKDLHSCRDPTNDQEDGNHCLKRICGSGTECRQQNLCDICNGSCRANNHTDLPFLLSLSCFANEQEN